MTLFKPLFLALLILSFSVACNTAPTSKTEAAKSSENEPKSSGLAPDLAQKYTTFTLTTDTSVLTEKEKQMLPLLIEISQIMDELFWLEAYGEKEPFLAAIKDPDVRNFADINYGPWDRLDANKPFLDGFGEKPAGAQFYPADIKKEEVENAQDAAIRDLYTMVRRTEDGGLEAVPYHQAFKAQIEKAAAKLKEAAALAEDPGLKRYLELRASAFLTDDYRQSDLAWMDMKTNTIDFVVGPIEVYEDELFNYKAAHEAYVLIKDKEWSQRLAHYAKFLPELQRGLPVDDKYKTENPGSDSELNAYDVVYYAGHSNAGSKTIAINLPNDEQVQLAKGSRRLQLKNAMRAKFDKIMLPISEELIEADQRQHVTFEAFFANTMFHEVAHGLGVKMTINDKGTVSEALKEKSSALEEGKADILGLYMISQLLEKGEMTGDIRDYYVTFISGIFRSVRFGGSSAHGRANLLRFNFFKEMGAFERNPETGLYHVNFDKMNAAMEALSNKILTLQGDGDYEGVNQLMKEKAVVGPNLAKDLEKLAKAGIPTDVVFKQGLEYLKLD